MVFAAKLGIRDQRWAATEAILLGLRVPPARPLAGSGQLPLNRRTPISQAGRNLSTYPPSLTTTSGGQLKQPYKLELASVSVFVVIYHNRAAFTAWGGQQQMGAQGCCPAV